jgi:hypothetical protein
MIIGVGWVVRPSQTRMGAQMGMVGAMVTVWVVMNGLGGVVGATYHFFVFLLTRLAAGCETNKMLRQELMKAGREHDQTTINRMINFMHDTSTSPE